MKGAIMPADLQPKLAALLPKAIAWAEQLATQVANDGIPISEELQALARRLGVMYPENIRIMEVQHLPKPDDPELCHACFAAGMLGANMTGLTLGYHIMALSGCCTPALLAHEFRHVYQFEEAGSLTAFLTIYSEQVLAFGYNGAPLEWDARQQEKFGSQRTG